MSAWISGFVGLISAFLLGTFYLRIGPWQSLRCVLASNVAGMVALFVAVRGGNKPWVRKYLMPDPLRTWFFFLLTYFGPLVALSSPLWNERAFEWMVFPLILSAGFTILVFGPIQDRLVARSQLEQARSRSRRN